MPQAARKRGAEDSLIEMENQLCENILGFASGSVQYQGRSREQVTLDHKRRKSLVCFCLVSEKFLREDMTGRVCEI